MTNSLNDLRVKVFADGADLMGIASLARNPLIRGFTTNPTLMRKAGVTQYVRFARDALQLVGDLPISFEVFSDDFADMEKQALEISTWGPNVFVKIPVTNTAGVQSLELIRSLCSAGVRVNVTAVFTVAQAEWVAEALAGGPPANISVFAGRIADAGVDPIPTVRRVVELVRHHPEIEIIWASPREVLNIVQADDVGCHIITVTHDVLKKVPLIGTDLDQFSLETVRMFRNDAIESGFTLQ